MAATPGNVEFTPLAVVAFFDVVAMALQKPMDGVGAEAQDAGQRRPENQYAAFAHMRAGRQQIAQKRLVAGVGDNQGVRLLVRAGAGFQVADLFIAMSAEPEQGRKAAGSGDADHAGPGDPGTLQQGYERIAGEQAAGDVLVLRH